MSVSDKPQPFSAGHKEHRMTYRLPLWSQEQPQLSWREQEMLSQREFEIMLLLPSVVTSSWWRRVEGCSKSNQILSKYFPCMSVQSPYTITSILTLAWGSPGQHSRPSARPLSFYFHNCIVIIFMFVVINSPLPFVSLLIFPPVSIFVSLFYFLNFSIFSLYPLHLLLIKPYHRIQTHCL